MILCHHELAQKWGPEGAIKVQLDPYLPIVKEPFAVITY